MQLLIQQIQIPTFNIAKPFKVETGIGNYKSIQNQIVKPAGSSLNVTLLDTTNTIFQHFFYKWMNTISIGYDIGQPRDTSTGKKLLTALKTNMLFNKDVANTQFMSKNGNFLTGNDWPFPRINLAIPIYKDTDIAKYTTEQLADGAAEPNFIYYFQGCFPTSIDSVQLKMQANLNFKRNIKFQYNNAIIISSKSIAKYYGVEQIWNKKQMQQKKRQAKSKDIFDQILFG